MSGHTHPIYPAAERLMERGDTDRLYRLYKNMCRFHLRAPVHVLAALEAAGFILDRE